MSPDSRYILSLGSFHIAWYAVLILTGALCAYALAQRTMKKWGYEHSILEDYLLPMLLTGIIGARIYYVIFQWPYYSQNPNEIVAIWHGGLAIHGGLIAGLLFSIVYFKKRKISCLRMFDAIMPNVLLAQAFGRWGNFMNQEAYGGIVPESYYAHFPQFIKERMYIDGAYRQPTFLYESVLDLCGFLFIYFIFRRHLYRRRGDAGWMYLIWYGISRFIVEGMRTDSLMAGSLRMAQVISVVFVIVGICGLAGLFHRRQKPTVIFDLDGVLIDSKPLIFDTFTKVMRDHQPDRQLTEAELETVLGPTLEESFRRFLSDEDPDQLVEEYESIMFAHYDQVKPMPHASETVKALKDMHIPMAVVSNKRHDAVCRGLEVTGLNEYFEVVLGVQDLPAPKPSASGLIKACDLLHTNHDDCVYIGDTAGDIETAKNMAAFSVAYGQDTQMAALHPCAQISDLSQLVDLIKEDRTWSDNTIW
ncbi:prolipoprotein diacylglyceryl transferase [Catenisphaera adipataccumulans]|uniref:Phosphatidylglycerol--prolipoprotein diacylglyceryl transferase n=1 Tax=Catenisphaera adipataccumulans TaxID=700500 RepID=A0A7W8CYU9_9FIRM|nr:prolipoprotein diacylglyceryl transferase [Catenisphaera adipataccumulans]MBB5182465.1 phosphatidylglycerol:prolipoprotein diacylglycerol transferase [Catenisphaera adipataccumulans]